MSDDLVLRLADHHQREIIDWDLLIDAKAEIEQLRAEVAMLRRLDKEAASNVESVICARTGFTGDPPYVGWKGLGIALSEALNERDALRARIEAGVIVEVKQAGDDEFGQARVLAYSTRDELRKGPPLVFKRVALVPLDD